MTRGREQNEADPVVVAQVPSRSYIETRDSDGNGVKDWEENLQARIFETVSVPTSTPTGEIEEPYTEPATLTGRFSEAFMQDYLQGKMEGVDYSDPSAFVANAVAAIEQNVRSKTHTRLELSLMESSPEALRAYGNDIGDIVKRNSINNENEAFILQKALSSNNPDLLKDLEPIKRVYAQIIQETLAMEVPLEMGEAHVNLLNSFEAIYTDITAMQSAFTDPLFALARIKEYEDDALEMFNAFKAIADFLDSNNVTYAKDEGGAFFYLFDS
jgi:hypothetical protein